MAGLFPKCCPRANDIYEQLQPGGVLAPYFVEINDKPGSDFPDFSSMQTEANNGKAIIGAYSKPDGVGHVVMMMPESYSETTKPKIEGTEIDRPITLECGSNDKSIKPNEFKPKDLKTYKWYYYNGK